MERFKEKERNPSDGGNKLVRSDSEVLIPRRINSGRVFRVEIPFCDILQILFRY